MIKHIVLWNFKPDTAHRDIDEITFRLLELKKLDEVLELTVQKSNFKSSTKDYFLSVTLLNEKDLKAYQENPEHKKVAALIEKSFTKRECFDVEY